MRNRGGRSIKRTPDGEHKGVSMTAIITRKSVSITRTLNTYYFSLVKVVVVQQQRPTFYKSFTNLKILGNGCSQNPNTVCQVQYSAAFNPAAFFTFHIVVTSSEYISIIILSKTLCQ